MVKKAKTGKDRLDKYYHLAKDQGYRARSAFKLIQLAKKSDFLSKSKVCIDLCAAPGGWSQVAQKNMPKDSQVIAIDLVPIKPMHGVTCLQGDITAVQTQHMIKKTMHGAKADCVLNDGAPNVGASWSKDAFSQAELTLAALKVACEHLRSGGTFVTKVFRSADYNSLLWVFGQLFSKVDATKPQASRNVSAEIFVLCTGYRAPAKIDPKLLDPKYVFMEVEDTITAEKRSQASLGELIQSQPKRKRQGYTEEERTMLLLDAKDFVMSKQSALLLTTHRKIVFESDEAKEIAKNPLTTDEIRLLCEDLQLLGKRDLTQLAKWRFNLVRQHVKSKKAARGEKEKTSGDEGEEAEGKTVEADLDEMIKRREADEKAEAKKKRTLKKKEEWRKTMSLGGMFSAQDEPDLFKRTAQNMKLLKDEDKYVTHKADEDQVEEESASSDSDASSESEHGTGLSRLEKMEVDIELALDMAKAQADSKSSMSKGGKAAERKAKETRRQKVTAGWIQEMESFNAQIDQAAEVEYAERQKDSDSDDDDDDDDDDDSADERDAQEKKDDARVAAMQLGSEEAVAKKAKHSEREPDGDDAERSGETDWKASGRADRWFSQDIFSGLGAGKTAGGDAVDDAYATESEVGKDDIVENEVADADLPRVPLSDRQKRNKKRQKQEERLIRAGIKKPKVSEQEKVEVVPMQEPVPLDHLPADEKRRGPQKPTDPQELAETLAMGSLMIQKKSRMDLIDSAFNRWTFDAQADLPKWFIDEEKKFNKPELPVSKELMGAFRDKLKEINARPIRKVAEAQGRKRKRLNQRIDKLRKTAASLAENDEMSNRAKANMMRKMVSKAKRSDQQQVAYVALKKGGGPGGKKGAMGNVPKGAKVKVVDRRLKSDLRAKKRAIKKGGKAARRKLAGRREKKCKKGPRKT